MAETGDVPPVAETGDVPPPPAPGAFDPPRRRAQPGEVKFGPYRCPCCDAPQAAFGSSCDTCEAPQARFEALEPTLYGDPIAVVIQALLHVIRKENTHAAFLVEIWRTEGADPFKSEHFEGIAQITGVTLEVESPLQSANAACEAWLIKCENEHVPETLDLLYERVFISGAWDDPENLSNLCLLEGAGIRAHNRELTPRVSLEYNSRARKQTEISLKLIAAMEAKGVPAEDKSSMITLKWLQENRIKDCDFMDHSYALNQMTGIHQFLLMLLSQTTPVKSRQDAWNFIHRMQAIPGCFKHVCDQMERQKSAGIIPPRFVVEKVTGQLENMLNGEKGLAVAPKESVFYNVFLGMVKDPDGANIQEVPEDMLAALEAAVSKEVHDAYKALLESWVKLGEAASAEGHEDHAGVGELPDGKAFYAWKLGEQTTTSLTPEEVHQLGLDQIKEIKDELEVVVARLAEKDETLRGDESAVDKCQALRKQQRWLYPFTEDEDGKRTFPQESKDACLKDYRDLVKAIEPIIDPLFDIRPKTPLRVEAVPPHMENGTPAAFYMQGSMDGTRDGAFFVNLGDMMAQWKSFMRVLMAHEGIPGHHFQIALQQEMEKLPFFRRVPSGFVAFIEGWALYTETLARELKFYATEEDGSEGYDLLGYFAANMLRAARLVVDTGLHHFGWSREKAVEYFQKNTLEAPASGLIEIERYCIMPGQATSYKVGQLQIMALRKKLQEEQGEAFDLIQFHRRMLQAGPVPLDMLADMVASDL